MHYGPERSPPRASRNKIGRSLHTEFARVYLFILKDPNLIWNQQQNRRASDAVDCTLNNDKILNFRPPKYTYK